MPKKELMEVVANEVKACRKCELWKTRSNAVPGEGSLDATTLFIGEAPGYWEDVKGRPFVGAAGKLLDTLLADANLSRSTVYITNVVKCRPPKNRVPSPVEVKTCTPYLNRQIKTIQPEIIVTLGRHATSYVLSEAGVKEVVGITKLRGEVYSVKLFGLSVSVLPTFHPAAVLHNPKYEDPLKHDFQLLKSLIEKPRQGHSKSK
ncbi:MAG: type-4 uracil-DNA glycosylase [Candidatus Bathyarchaeota archaeon]|nr:type-4 uracil-DNA glycosylase [Candidatus Bathyarchaeota archaeon]